MTRLPFVVLLAIVLATSLAAASESPLGYYRSPSLNGDTVLFTAEGDLWTVGTDGGVARRLTSHLDEEIYGAISPDGEWVAFSADYEGPTEVYVMPLAGGLPSRITWHGDGANVVGWTPRGEVVYSAYYRVHRRQIYLEVVDPRTGATRPLPLMGAAEAAFDDAGTIFFTRYAFQGSHTRRYQGGTAQSLWRFDGADEAVPLTADHPGTDRHPMWWNDRLYFLSDRDASLDLWSMKSDGTDLQQHTHHHEWDVFEPSLHDGRIVYRLGADLRLLDLASGDDRIIPIRLSTDFDQRRVTWVDKPFDFLTSAYLSPDGDQVVLTARGEVFVAPVGQGRLVAAARNSGVRYRQARFAAGDDEAERDETIIALSDESGEVELWSLDPRGLEASAQLTDNGSILRFTTLPSPDGAKIAFSDKDNELWVFDRASGATTKIATSRYFGFRGFTWSPDSRWLAFSIPAENLFSRIGLYDSDAETGEGDEAIEILWATSDRFDSFDPVFSPDGKWLYFLSTRNLTNTVGSPWGPYAPQPHLDQTTEIFQLALVDGTRSPFAPPTELDDANKEDDAKQDNGKDKKKDKGKSDDAEAKDGATDDDDAITTRIEVEGLFDRLERVPTPAGNYAALAMTASHLYWIDTDERSLRALKITNEKPEAMTVIDRLGSFDLSADGKKMLVMRDDTASVIDTPTSAGADLSKGRVAALDGWTFPLDPSEAWRQMYFEAWRLMRDYFYDEGMHGVDWPAMRDKYAPLVDRVTTRRELSDVLGQMIGELSALHHFVTDGETREGRDDIGSASLGAVLERDDEAGGWRVATRHRTDPDMPAERGPLAHPRVAVEEGDVIVAINGQPTLDSRHPAELLRNQAGKQVLLEVADGESGDTRQVIVEPIGRWQARELRNDAWELERRELVEERGDGRIGYVHLRAMGGNNYTEWARHYFPVWNRDALILDMRGNSGGNIDSWILGQLLRKRWMWWNARNGTTYPNMQFAFDGPMIMLVDARTASDGEAVADGFRRLGLGKVLGTRTWGGEIWLTSSNVLVDWGIATAAEFGVFGPEGNWLIEGWGLEPDIVVDNLPHATWNGTDAQLDAAIDYLLDELKKNPPPPWPEPPPFPDKSQPPAPTRP